MLHIVRRAHYGLIGLLAFAFVVIGHAATAVAGTYEVYACDPNHAGGGTPSWVGWSDPGLTAYSNCPGAAPEGIVTRSVAGSGATSSGFQGGFAAFDAPSGTTINSIHGYFYLQRAGCNWGAGIKATSGDLTGRWVYAMQPGYCGTNEIGWLYWDWPINDKRVVQVVVCGASSCDRSSETRAAMRSVRITIDDPTPPELTSPRGALWTNPDWLSGIQDIAFDAADGAGIRRSNVQVDDQVVRTAQHVCDDTQRSPCPNGGLSDSVDTSKIHPDGEHKLTLETVDTAGNPTQVTKTIRVDNTAPPAPGGLGVDGGDGWRASNTFSLSWTNPADDGGAPIAEAIYSMCPAGGGECVTASRAGEGVTTLTGVSVPTAGDWTLSLWLRDAAGNADSSTATPPVHLRFDDGAPTVAFDPPNPSDPTLVAATASDAASAVANGHIEIRKRGTDAWRSLPSTYDGTRITARLDDEHLPSGAYDLRAWAIDAAGNERTSTDLADGGAAKVRLPVRVVTRIKAGVASRSRRTRASERRNRVRTRWGRRVRLGGRLLTADGNPIASSDVLVFSRERLPSAPWVAVAALKTSRRGYFAYVAPKGASRTIRFRFGGTATIRPSVRAIALLVRARSTIHADHTRLLNGEYVHLRGRALGGPIPSGGLLIEIQARLRGRWRTFRTAHTSGKGRWRLEYRFDGTHGRQTYPLRARIPSAPGYPYATGRSRSIKIHVSGL